MIFNELIRLYFIIRIILIYGLIDFIPTNRLIFLLRIKNRFLLRTLNQHSNIILAERLRLALQELGPIWIKFGQILSTRHDILSKNIIDQLTLLQDRVTPIDGVLAKTHIEEYIGVTLETWFENFQETPLASASIAQVHSAKLKKNGKNVVIKFIRPGIQSIIKTDINLMYKIANWSYKVLPKDQKFKFSEIILEYKNIIFNEVNLLKETANTLQLKRNFKSSKILYIPKVYIDFCNKNVIVMERIYGTPIYNIDQLKDAGVNMKLLAERGIEIFFTQVFRDSFFHGDMHPGNIFINHQYPNNPKYISIDCGIMGSLSKKDKYYLASNFLAFFNHDYRKIAELHIDSGWVPIDTNIIDFECAMRMVFEPIFEQPIEKIAFSNLLLYLFNIARYFKMEIQPQLLLLQKTLLYIEGIVRQLHPHLNLWVSTEPFFKKWIKEQTQLSRIAYTLKSKIPYWIEKIPDLPILVCHELTRSKEIQKKIEILTKELQLNRNNTNQGLFLLGLGIFLIIGGVFSIALINMLTSFSMLLFFFGIIIWTIGWIKIIKS